MFRSLRFQIPALFLAGVIVAGLVAAAIAFQLLQSYTLSRARADLRRETSGLARLYTQVASGSNDAIPRKQLEAMTGDSIYFVPRAPGIEIFTEGPNLRRLPKSAIDFDAVAKGRTVQSSLQLPR